MGAGLLGKSFWKEWNFKGGLGVKGGGFFSSTRGVFFGKYNPWGENQHLPPSKIFWGVFLKGWKPKNRGNIWGLTKREVAPPKGLKKGRPKPPPLFRRKKAHPRGPCGGGEKPLFWGGGGGRGGGDIRTKIMRGRGAPLS